MSKYYFTKRPKRDQTLMNKGAVRSLGKGKSGGRMRLAEQFLQENPQLKRVFNKHSERRALAAELFERGGGKRASKMYDRFGYTEGDLVETLKGMRDKGLISRREMIQAARKTFKSSEAYRRKSLRELYAHSPSSQAKKNERLTTKRERVKNTRSKTEDAPRDKNKAPAADRFLEKTKTRQQLALDVLQQRKENEKDVSARHAEGEQKIHKTESKTWSKSKYASAREQKYPNSTKRGKSTFFLTKNEALRDFGTRTPQKENDTSPDRNSTHQNGPQTSGYTDARRFLENTPKQNLSTGITLPTPDTMKRDSVTHHFSSISSADVHKKAA